MVFPFRTLSLQTNRSLFVQILTVLPWERRVLKKEGNEIYEAHRTWKTHEAQKGLSAMLYKQSAVAREEDLLRSWAGNFRNSAFVSHHWCWDGLACHAAATEQLMLLKVIPYLCLGKQILQTYWFPRLYLSRFILPVIIALSGVNKHLCLPRKRHIARR